MTRLRDKIPVEPFDPDRLARVERSLMTAYAQLEPQLVPRRRWGRRWVSRLAIPVASIAVAVATVAVMWSVASRAELAMSSTQPARVVTGDAPTTLQLDGSTIQVAGNTTVDLLREPEGGTTLLLTRGRVDCEVEPRMSRPPFIVHAADVRVVVVGTIFSVERHGDDVRVKVTRGKVRVERPMTNGEATFVAAHEQWSPRTGMIASVGEPVTTVAGDVTSPGPDRTPDLGRHRAATPKPRGVGPAHRHRRPGVRRPRARTRRGQSLPPERSLSAAGLPPPMNVGVSEPRAAISKYLQISMGEDSDKAGAALYSMAYVQYKRLGNRVEALRATEHYERRFSGGPHYRDVLWLRILASCQRDVDSRCRKAAYRYLRKFSASNGNTAYAARLEQARLLVNSD